MTKFDDERRAADRRYAKADIPVRTMAAISLPSAERGVPTEQLKRWERARTKLARRDLRPREREAAISTMISIEAGPGQEQEREFHDRSRRELVTLSALRDEPVDLPAATTQGAAKPARRLSGLQWLWSKGRLPDEEMAAGLKYGDDWRVVDEVSVRSCLGDDAGGSGMAPQEAMQVIRERLDRARRALNSTRLVKLCDLICGEGRRIREIANGDDQAAIRREAELSVALEILAKHYKIST